MRIKHALIALCLIAVPAAMSAKDDIDKYYNELTEMSVDENIDHPEVPKKQVPGVIDHMAKLAKMFDAAGLQTDLSLREGMVLLVTVPAADFFAPNDTVVRPSANPLLRTVASQMQVPNRYKLLITVHSDDTGSEDYLVDLTQARADALMSKLGALRVDTRAVVPYGLGHDEPLNDGKSREARAKNRRVEFYFVPGPTLIQEIKRK